MTFVRFVITNTKKTKDMTFQERVEFNKKINEEGRKILEEWKRKFGSIKKHR